MAQKVANGDLARSRNCVGKLITNAAAMILHIEGKSLLNSTGYTLIIDLLLDHLSDLYRSFRGKPDTSRFDNSLFLREYPV